MIKRLSHRQRGIIMNYNNTSQAKPQSQNKNCPTDQNMTKSAVSHGRLAQKLKELRLSHGYKQSDISGAIEISQSTYSHYETGIRTPKSLILYRIAAFYGLPVDDLLKLSIPLDNEIYYDAPYPTPLLQETDEFLKYMQNDDERSLSQKERELLYHFSMLTVNARQEVIDFADFKRQQEQKLFASRHK